MARQSLAKGLGIIQCFGLTERLLLAGLGTLCTVLGAGLHPVLHALGIQSAADDVVTDTGKVLNTTATDQHHGVLLNVCRNAL